MEVIGMTVSLNWIAEFPALTVLQPCFESCGLAWANSLYAKRGFKALIDLTLTIHHKLFTCNGKVANPDDAVAFIVAAMAFAMAVAFAVAVAVAMAVAVTVAVIVFSMDNGRRFDQVPFKLTCSPILLFIRILLTRNDDVTVQDLFLEINVQLELTILSPVNEDSLPFLIYRPMRIAGNRGAHKVIVAITPELNREFTLRALEIPFCAFTVSIEHFLDRAQSPEVKSLSPILRVRFIFWKSITLQVFS
mmetsp:Transcript_134904/g.234513  ORF Transcript_134904/g.234513 Transcript_134904/m.234513 type:complete len:248 (-) Transcript_134904:301-1044(-)